MATIKKSALSAILDRDANANITSRVLQNSNIAPYLEGLSNLEGIDLVASFNITAAQLETDIATTPVTVLAAPGAGKINIPKALLLSYTFGSTAYDDVDLTFRYAGTTNALMVAQEINGAADEDWLLFPITGNGAALSATPVNKAIEVIASADPDGVSNGDGSFTGYLLYNEVDLS